MRGTVPIAILGAAFLALLSDAGDAARRRVVAGAVPTNGQEVTPDLSDPEVYGMIRIHARIPAPRIAELEEGTPEVPLLSLRDQDGEDVPFDWTHDPDEDRLVLQTSLPLAPAQYGIELSARFLGRRERALGRGRGFSSSFTVGPDLYPPVLLAVRPGEGALDVCRRTPIVLRFNESLDPASVVLAGTVHVEEISVQPPRPIPGTVFLDREGFDLVFRPDPRHGLPAAAMVGVRLLGVGNPDHVRDAAGNGLVGDPEDGNQLRAFFSTR
jgi:hypothetical protein